MCGTILAFKCLIRREILDMSGWVVYWGGLCIGCIGLGGGVVGSGGFWEFYVPARHIKHVFRLRNHLAIIPNQWDFVCRCH